MDQKTARVLFSQLRCAITGMEQPEKEKNVLSPEELTALLKTAQRHDVVHLLALGLKRNGLMSGEGAAAEKYIYKAAIRCEQQQYELTRLCTALEQAQIPFIPLKGSVLRGYYPEPWMRTSCDIDVLVHKEDLAEAINCLCEALQYTEKDRSSHDVSLYSPLGVHVELHFDLVEEGRAQRAIDVLQSVWEHASPWEDGGFRYKMSDAFFYFYHIAHMAKHFETGGCGIRPFLDLWILDRMTGADKNARDELLSKGDLLKFANTARTLSEIWLGGGEADEFFLFLEEFLLMGGAFGTVKNRVALQQKKTGGKWGYILSRVFVPGSKLKRYYPILEKHPYLMPVMQVRRWCMLAKPDVAKMAKAEISANGSTDSARAEEMRRFLDGIGL